MLKGFIIAGYSVSFLSSLFSFSARFLIVGFFSFVLMSCFDLRFLLCVSPVPRPDASLRQASSAHRQVFLSHRSDQLATADNLVLSAREL